MDTPRPEHPRPDRYRETWLNLNGEWECGRDPGLSGQERGLPAGGSLPERIVVPFCPESELSGVGDPDFLPCVWYRRSLQVPEAWLGRRCLLHFGAVDYETSVWLNGVEVGRHRGGYTPFMCDLTPQLRQGDNALVVRAVDDTRSPIQPTGKQATAFESSGCHYTRTTGIWQTVWLEAVPSTYIGNFRCYPRLAEEALGLEVQVVGPAAGLTLVARALVGREELARVAVPAASRTGLSLALPGARLWDPASPFLYDLELTLEEGGMVVDRLQSYFGMRELQLEGKGIRINGRPVFQRLVLDQGYYPGGVYTAPSDEALKRDVELGLAMGFNGARLHEKIFEPRFLYWADRLGYLVWGEYPNWGLNHADPRALGVVLPEWLEGVERDFNHPAIVGWCPFNETPVGQNPDLIRGVYRATKAADATRPVLDTSGYVHVETDIYDCHNYEQDPERFAAAFAPFLTSEEVWRNFPAADAPYRGQPYFVSEYGGIGWNPRQEAKAWGYGQWAGSAEELVCRYRALTEVLLNHPKMFGFCYTQLYDIEQEQNGLYTYDREAKVDPELIRRINRQTAAIER